VPDYNRWQVRVALTLALASCVPGKIGDPGSSRGTTGGGPSTGGPNAGTPNSPGACAQSVTLDTIVADWATRVQPLLVDPADGCLACHSPSSGRQFQVTTDAGETFHLARAANLLSDQPGTILDRIKSTNPATAMPRGLPHWSMDQIQTVADVVCELAAYGTSGATPADEQFPPELLMPYTGPAITDYDNTFIGYLQLKSKVHAVFSDDWVRNGTDNFAANIGAFGGVDFASHFTEARVATSDFLVALDQLAKDVCHAASQTGAGPFTGINVAAPLVDTPPQTTQQFSAIDPNQMVPSTGQVEGTNYDLYTNGTLTLKNGYDFSAAGTYKITVHAWGDLSDSIGPTMELHVNGIVRQTFTNLPTTPADYTFTGSVSAGAGSVAVAFTNDAVDSTGDRNLHVENLSVTGPLGMGTGTNRQNAAIAGVGSLYRKMLYRVPTSSEAMSAYTLLTDLNGSIGTGVSDAWAGLCEGLMKSPDFLFTLPPSVTTVAGGAQDQLVLVKVAQDLVARPPTDAEFSQLAQSSIPAMIDQYLASSEWRDYFFYKMRIRTESDGTTVGDEPGRLWTYLMTSGESFDELLDGDFSVDPMFAKQSRPPEHGNTGVLTMKGYLLHKKGLPHFNYSARVLSDFMGYIFEVPPEVIAQRINATAASTVQPNTICFNCHQLLTPLAYQRLRWRDNGTYTSTNADGSPIDDSDHNLVAAYPYKGQGLQAFSTQAVKKERFVRQTLNAEFNHLFGREIRYDQDERTIYKSLWDTVQSTRGDLRATLKLMMMSPAYQGRNAP
jgi:hypothetical protein